ncbi:unnamed protein product [Prorocentrum cordatum]|uniref:Cyclic nucleotide-binding domain-containing protein n=1 Tax=Prorocentrum cordatum TaxID=2364126 RepID=A0ABN9PL84_9DINO|nr:unnamed protein product [Polarella glacialis]
MPPRPSFDVPADVPGALPTLLEQRGDPAHAEEAPPKTLEAPCGCAASGADAALEEGAAAAGGEAAARELVHAELAASPLFAQCEPEVVRGIVRGARGIRLGHGDELDVSASGRAWVVVAGALEARVGPGRAALLGPRTMLNVCGLLGSPPEGGRERAECEQWYRPAAPSDEADKEALAVEAGCVRTLCSQAFAVAGSRGAGQKAPDTLSLTVVGAPPRRAEGEADDALGPAQQEPHSPARHEAGGAWLAAMTVGDVLKVVAGSSSQAQFTANRESLLERWSVALRRRVFPGAPPDALFSLVESAQVHHVSPGDKLATEGESGDAAEALLVLDSGEAAVEKCVPCRDGQGTRVTVMGFLGPGAIVGDACFIGSGMPRPATVRAKTAVTVLIIPSDAILEALRRFPGCLACLHAGVREGAALLQPSLQSHTEVLLMQRLFGWSCLPFVRAVASASERRVLYCGEAVKQEGGSDAALYVVEFGICSVSREGCGDVGMARMGTCFGERELIGIHSVNRSTVRVSTPFAVLLMVPQTAFGAVLSRFPDEERRVRGSTLLPSQRGRGSDVASFPCFRTCSQNFCEDLARSVEIRYYCPGQTVMVEGAMDAAHMSVLKGGRAVVEKRGKKVADVAIGTNFGEFAMMGIARRRGATVRAVTLCQMLEVPRAAFLAALDRNPEDRQHFEKLTTQYSAAETGVRWPLFVDTPANLLYHVNLYTDRYLTPAGSWTSRASGAQLPEDAAVLVLQGSILVEGPGDEVLEFVDGQCFNEQVLVGFPRSGRLVAKEASEVQIMTRETFEKVMAAHPDQRTAAERNILQEMACKAVKRLGFSHGSVGILRFSSLFRAVSDQFALLEGAEGDTMYLLLVGDVQVEASDGLSSAHDGQRQAFGEAVLLGIASAYGKTLRARSSCLVQALPRGSLDEVLDSFPRERALFAGLRVQGCEGSVDSCLARAASFSRMEPEFVSTPPRQYEDVFYAPGEEILTRGDPCALGRSSLFLLMSGQANVEGLHSQRLGSLSPGHVFGEAGALGYAPARTATVRAWRAGLTHCAVLQGPAIEAATKRFPETHRLFKAIFEERQDANACIEECRQDWVHEVVVPALRRSRLFAGLATELVQRVALPLAEVKYGAGEFIAQAGESLDRMFFLLQGRAEVLSREGRVLGDLSGGAVLGEAAVLGLLPVSTAAVRAASECRALVVLADGVREVASSRDASPLRRSLQLLKEERLRQASSGLPACALGIGLAAQDFCARVVNLQAECIEMRADSTWHPLPDSDPCGPHFGVLVGGRGTLVLGFEERPVMALMPGSLLPEGLYAKYGAHVRAQTASQVYRVRLVDIMLAFGSANASFRSFVLFEALWKEARARAASRLKCACGARGAPSGTLSDSSPRPQSSGSLSRDFGGSLAGPGRTDRPRSEGAVGPGARGALGGTLGDTSLRPQSSWSLSRDSGGTLAGAGRADRPPREGAPGPGARGALGGPLSDTSLRHSGSQWLDSGGSAAGAGRADWPFFSEGAPGPGGLAALCSRYRLGEEGLSRGRAPPRPAPCRKPCGPGAALPPCAGRGRANRGSTPPRRSPRVCPLPAERLGSATAAQVARATACLRPLPASPAPRGEAAARVLSEARAEAGRGAAAAPAEARAEGGREAAAALAEAEPTERRLVDRPLVAWLIEIACIGSVAWLRSQVPAPDHSSACGAALRTLATSLATVEGCTLAHAVLVHKVYAHVPPFSAPAPQARPPTWRGVLSDWLACNLPVHVLAVGLSALAARGRRAGGGARAPRAWLASLRRLRLGPFLVKLVVARLVADVTCPGGSRAGP